MPKKSQATLDKETQIKAKVQEFTNFKSTPLNFKPKLVGKPLKESTDVVVVRKGVFTPHQAGYLRALSKGGWSFVVSLSGPTLTVTHPFYSSTGYPMGGGKIDVVSTDYKHNPLVWVQNQVFTDHAVAATWPDELGKSLVYLHKHSLIAMKYKSTPGINKEKLSELKNWHELARFLLSRPTWRHTRQPICDIVKAISTNLSEAELQKMAKNSKEFDYGF